MRERNSREAFDVRRIVSALSHGQNDFNSSFQIPTIAETSNHWE
jgi:hypothetical protein